MARNLNPQALVALGEQTRAQLDTALCTIVAGDTKFLGGENLSNEEAVEYVRAQRLVNAFSGEIVLQTLQMLIRSQRGQRIFAKALPPSLIVNVNAQPGPTVQDFERDAEGEIKRVVSRPVTASSDTRRSS